jgi:hypothetical protein
MENIKLILEKRRTFYKMLSLIIISIIINSECFGQDTLKYRIGNILICKVLEITPALVKYKKIENLEGPTYVDVKNDLEFIKFKNGQTELFEFEMPSATVPVKLAAQPVFAQKNPSLKKMGPKFLYGNDVIGNKEYYGLMLSLNNKKITNHINLAKQQRNWQCIGFLAIPFGVAALANLDMGYNSYHETKTGWLTENEKVSVILAGLGVACFTTSITLKVKRNQNEAAALKLYQQNY